MQKLEKAAKSADPTGDKIPTRVSSIFNLGRRYDPLRPTKAGCSDLDKGPATSKSYRWCCFKVGTIEESSDAPMNTYGELADHEGSLP